MNKEKELTLCIDVGNTNIRAGLFKGQHMLKKFIINKDIKNYMKGVKKVLIVSVSPARLKGVLAALNKAPYNRIPIYIAGKDIKVPLKSCYSPSEIGQDRLVTAYAASRLYSTPVLIIDFGTAVTFDIMSAENIYLGGLIFPGIKMSIESLHAKTALLPEIALKKTKGFIAVRTDESIRNGLIFGYAAVCEGLISKFRRKFRDLKIVATGGNAKLIASYTRSIPNIDEDLSIKGLSCLI